LNRRAPPIQPSPGEDPGIWIERAPLLARDGRVKPGYDAEWT
jgi:hypothetical protein